MVPLAKAAGTFVEFTMRALMTLIISLVGTLPLSAATFLFRADLTPGAVVPSAPEFDPSDTSTASGTAFLTLTTGEIGGPRLSYELRFDGLDVSENIPRPVLDGPDQLIRAIHIHFGAAGINGGHALNIYGFPREDDGDLIVNSSQSLVSGVWDDEDENLPGSSALSDALTELHAGELYFQVHTMGFRDGEIRGQISPIPEPSVTLLLGFGNFLLLIRRRRPS